MTVIEQLTKSAEYIFEQVNFRPRVAVTLGSGLSAFAETIEVEAAIPYSQIPHLLPTTVEGHPGQMVLGHLNGVPVALLQGRIHLYEGHDVGQVVYPTRLLKQLGAEILVLTNAAGGLDPKMQPGDFMIIRDHINLTGTNPLLGPNIEAIGPRFPDMSTVYDKQLSEKLTTIMRNNGLRYFEGTYCGVLGPSYETPAEVSYLQKIGGQAVGMSTVAEAIAARHAGLRICGLSCITNLASGISQQQITHDEVKEVARRVENDFNTILKGLIVEL
ncbi:MAG: purine-nucleoside phosphorylase [Pseudobdellovibrionaceae bacterium]|nr:purine-nucleoside phosphorylase [Bdellovibrionales bacterium]USN46892.1 MAG: purine-nucleoside phosphorylase [Pseudobdellovibrionaceae bacterium]